MEPNAIPMLSNQTERDVDSLRARQLLVRARLRSKMKRSLGWWVPMLLAGGIVVSLSLATVDPMPPSRYGEHAKKTRPANHLVLVG